MGIVEYLREVDNLYIMTGLLIFTFLLKLVFVDIPEARDRWEIRRLVRNANILTIDEVRALHKRHVGRKTYNQRFNHKGFFVLYNETKKKYFIGADSHVFDGILWQVNGKGYVSVYDDVKNGDKWSIAVVHIDKTTHEELYTLWMTAIDTFKSDRRRRGYN